MNKLLYGFSLAAIVLNLTACKKETNATSDNTASVFVINGAVNARITLNTNNLPNASLGNTNSSNNFRINFGAGAFFYAEGKSTVVDVFNFTTNSKLFTGTYDLRKAGIYSLLIAGVVPNIEGVLVDDTNLPYVNLSTATSSSDSVINIRFINLSPDLANIDVRIKGSTNNEVSAIAYKGASSWKSYPAKSVNGSYIFEFVDNGTVRKTQTLSISTFNRFKNVALVLTGMKTPASGQPALAVSTVNYFQ